jgi:hypothetical protein
MFRTSVNANQSANPVKISQKTFATGETFLNSATPTSKTNKAIGYILNDEASNTRIKLTVIFPRMNNFIATQHNENIKISRLPL